MPGALIAICVPVPYTVQAFDIRNGDHTAAAKERLDRDKQEGLTHVATSLLDYMTHRSRATSALTDGTSS